MSFLPANSSDSEKEPVFLNQASIKKDKEGLYTVSANGMAPTPGWTVELAAENAEENPEDLQISARGVRPGGIMAQVLTPWQASLQLTLNSKTKKITVKGKRKTITVDVPH